MHDCLVCNSGLDQLRRSDRKSYVALVVDTDASALRRLEKSADANLEKLSPNLLGYPRRFSSTAEIVNERRRKLSQWLSDVDGPTLKPLSESCPTCGDSSSNSSRSPKLSTFEARRASTG